ncbi:hypothetical protein [uncultured Friedmanniella sp.]|uniref:hypothetical protein n=1 Tax=uncultured Friedmanniella sp. TaxID=335381 RepID=UPI0035CB4776
MSKPKRTTMKGRGKPRHISVRAVRREQPDIARLGRAVVAMALAAQAEADAQAQASQSSSTADDDSRPIEDGSAE